jgi:hypothetical protein
MVSGQGNGRVRYFGGLEKAWGGNGASACNRVSAPPANAPNMDLQLLQVTNALTLELRWTVGDYDRLAKLTGPDSLVVYVEPEYSEQQAHRYPKRYSRTCRDHITIGLYGANASPPTLQPHQSRVFLKSTKILFMCSCKWTSPRLTFVVIMSRDFHKLATPIGHLVYMLSPCNAFSLLLRPCDQG